MISPHVESATDNFMHLSDEYAAKGLKHWQGKYTGNASADELGDMFYFVDAETTKIINKLGFVEEVSTPVFVAGTVAGLVERGDLDAAEWQPQQVGELLMGIGRELGKRQENKRIAGSFISEGGGLHNPGDNEYRVPRSWFENNF